MCPIGVCAAAVFLYPIPMAEKIRTGVLVALMLMLLFFAQKRSRIANEYLYDNATHPERFFTAFPILFAISGFFPMFTKTGWPLLFFAVVLTLFSDCTVGIVSYVTILCFTSILGQVDFYTFLFYFICGVCAVILFSVLDERFKIEIPLLLSLMCFLVSLCANIVITQNANLSLQMFLVPFISLFLNMVLIIMFLWYINMAVVSLEKNKYQEINDPEYELMIRIKEAGKDYYYHAIHTAYLCNRIAAGLADMDKNINVSAVRAAGFYRSAGVVKGEDNMDNLLSICEEYEFPDQTVEILKEYKKGGRLHTREAAILTMSAAVIDGLMYLIAQNPEADIQYGDVILTLFRKKTENGIFDQCDISIRDMNRMKKILVEEKLYYDFLR